MTKQWFEEASNKYKLTQREKEVLEEFLTGRSDKEIAAKLNISPNTVIQHIRKICIKSGIKDEYDRAYAHKRHELRDKYKPEEKQQPLNTQNDPHFVGRDNDIQQLDKFINQGAKVILIRGMGGMGKTTLAQKYLTDRFNNNIIEFPIAKETKDIASVEGLVEQRLRELGEEPGREFMVSLARLKQKLQNQPMGVLIDNLEPALDKSGRFIEPHRSYVELLRVLADSTVKSITLITSREPLNEGLDITIYSLPSLTQSAWQEYFNSQKINAEIAIFEVLHQAFIGNALAMKVLCDRISLDFEGNVAAFWQDYQRLGGLITVENLIKEQFNRLEKIYPEAYRLLCRLGCYRYQDVSTVPLEGLFCLLWDVETQEQKRVVKSLRDRALIDFLKEEYQLQPLIREQAINRLKNSTDWEMANRHAAEFWTESVKKVETVDHALKAFEAYHHYLSIEDYEQAAQVILKQRKTQWEKSEQLGKAFYRLGLLEPMIIAIEKIIYQLDYPLTLGFLYNILGSLFYFKGDLIKAIDYHIYSGTIVDKYRHNKQENKEIKISIKQLKKLYYVNNSICYINLFELEKAKVFLEEYMNFVENDIEHKNKKRLYYWAILAFLYSCLSFEEKAHELAQKAYKEISESELNSWAKGYLPLFLGLTYKNLGELNKSIDIYEQAIKYSEESGFKQVKGKALTGMAELYRLQEDYPTALKLHQESIEIFDKIGAKYDIAEAYFQQGLTYQQIKEIQKSQKAFEEALSLWQEIEAPKQIERVQKAIFRLG